MIKIFEGKHIILGVTGSIACYKAADLASKLAQAGAEVDVILTPSATKFITPLTFQSVTGRRAYVDADLWGSEGHVQHIALGRKADLLVIAPASANTLAKLAHGIADNLLTITSLAANCPLVIAPAMDGNMYTNPATQANLETLWQRGVTTIGPASGHLASGLVGAGRMVEPAEIFGHIRLILGRGGPLAGSSLLITAGGTEEPLDPVRSITNRSSGKQGFALAQAALDLGARVTLIAGVTGLPTPTGAERLDVRTARQMLEKVLEKLPQYDALVMAAAVADFRPAAPANQKIKKESGAPEIKLEANPDILAAAGRIKYEIGMPDVLVGFAAESQDLLKNAAAKLKAKNLDLIVANDISASDAGFGVDTNRVVLLEASGGSTSLPLMGKDEVAAQVMQRITALLDGREILHICPRTDWEAAQSAGEYRAASLESEGFIHCSRQRQLLRTANRFFHGVPDLVVLWIKPRLLSSPLRFEEADGQRFPHIYGALNLSAVWAVTPLAAGADGVFQNIALPEAA